ncbi:MAG: septum formation initiator family protein [Pseudomonadales bacterium]
MRWLNGLLFVLLLALQYKAWFGDVGYFAAERLRAQVAEQRARAEELEQRNRLLTAEVLALKQGLDAVEARARTDLGMVRQGETFFLIPDAQ